VMAGVGGCVVLLSSFIAAACIFTARRKGAELRAFKYSKHERGSWCDSDSVETVNDVKPFFKFGVRDKFVPEADYSEAAQESRYQLLPTQPPPHEASDHNLQQQQQQSGATPDILIEHTCGGGARHARLAVIQESEVREVTSPGSSEASSGDSGVCVGRVVRFQSEPTTKCLEYRSDPDKAREAEDAAKRKPHSVTFAEAECKVREFVPDKEMVVGEEYRGLLDQLATMRSLCDTLKQNNLRRDLDQLQASLHKYERATAVSCDVTQLRERYKTLSRMIQDAQSEDGISQDTSFMSGPHSDSDFIDLTQKF